MGRSCACLRLAQVGLAGGAGLMVTRGAQWRNRGVKS